MNMYSCLDIHKGKSKVASNEIRKKIYIDFHVYKKNNKF